MLLLIIKGSSDPIGHTLYLDSQQVTSGMLRINTILGFGSAKYMPFFLPFRLVNAPGYSLPWLQTAFHKHSWLENTVILPSDTVLFALACKHYI